MDKRVLNNGGKVGALAAAFLLGSVSLGNVFAQQAPPQPPMMQPQQQNRQPGYTGTIPAPQRSAGQSDEAEGAALQSLARITPDQARTAALQQFPNATVTGVGLDSENGFVVYEVRLTDAQGQRHEVQVDGGNAQVLHADRAGSEGRGGDDPD